MQRSKPATSSAIDHLLQLGVLSELGQGQRTLGRPPMLVAMNQRFRWVAGAEVDAGELRVGLGDLHGNLVEQRHYGWQRGQLGPALRLALDDLCAAHHAAVHALALGVPGVVHGRAVSHAPNLPELEDPTTLRNLQHELDLPTTLYNDVNLAAVSEARPEETLAFVSVGRGFGVGITHGQVLLSGHQGRAGELGDLPWPSAAGQVAQNLESVLSEAGLSRLLGLLPAQLPLLLSARDPTLLSRDSIKPFMDALLHVFQVLTLTLDPARIVIGGRIGGHLFTQLPALHRQLRLNLPFMPVLSVARHPESAVVRGAVQLAAATASQELISQLSRRAAALPTYA